MKNTFHQAYTKKKELQEIIIEKSTRKHPIKPMENFVKIENNIYFLEDSDWQFIYEKILNDNFNRLDTDFLIAKDQEVHLRGLKNTIKDTLTNFLNEYENEHKNKKLIYFLGFIFNSNIDLYTNTITSSLHNVVMSSIVKNKLTDMFIFEIPETNLSAILGKTLLHTYLYNIPELYFLSENINKVKDLSQFDKIEIIFKAIYDVYKNKNITDNLTKNELTLLQSSLNVGLGLHIDLLNETLIEAVSTFILLKSLKKSRKEDVRYIGITKYILLQTKLDDKTSLVFLERYLNERINRSQVTLGAIIVNLLINNNIFKSKLSYNDTEKTPYMLELNSNLIYDMVSNSSNFKHCLTYDNVNSIKNIILKTTVNDVALELELKSVTNAIHENLSGYAIFTPTSIFETDPDSLLVHLCIDSDFLNNYIAFIETYLLKNIEDFSPAEKPSLFLFLSIYTIDFELFYKNMDSKYHFILNSIVNYALDFNNYTCDDRLTKKLEVLEDKTLIENLKLMMKKISTYKLILKNLISEAIIYSMFGYFLSSSFFDFRGRRYFLGTNFNLQSYPFMKAFVKLYEPNHPGYFFLNIDLITSAIKTAIKDIELKKKAIELLSNANNYMKILDKNIIEFLYSFLNSSTILKSTFSQLMNYEFNSYTFSQLLHFINNHIKKKDKLLMVVSYIYLEINNKDYSKPYVNCYSYDEVMSGYQMIAILFRSLTGALWCNLTGKEKRDLYMAINDEFNYMINKVILPLTEKFQTLLKGKLDDNLSDQEARESLDINPNNYEQIFTKFIKLKLTDYTVNTIISMMDIIESSPLAKIIDFELKYIDCLIDKSNIAEVYITLMKKNNMYMKLIYLKQAFHLRSLLYQNKWLLEHQILTKRELFKNALMIEIYGGTYMGRKNALNDFFKDTFFNYGISSINNKALKGLMDYIERFYKFFRHKYLKEFDILKKIAQILTKNGKAITFKNINFQVIISPLMLEKDKPIRLTIPTLKKNKRDYKLTILIPKTDETSSLKDPQFKINKEKSESLFRPDFIHSMDAMLVHLMMNRNYTINKLLIEKNIKYTLYTIQDNFSMGRFLLPLLHILIKDCYIELYNYDYIHVIYENLKEEEINYIKTLLNKEGDENFLEGHFENDNFIKYG